MRLLILFATILFCVVVERIARSRYREAPFFRDYFTTDLVYLATALGLGLWMATIYVGPMADWIESKLPIARIAYIDLPRWVLVPVALAHYDFGSWLTHFLLHRSNTLWELHKVHHSARVVDWLATFRSHVLEQVLRNVIPPAVLIVVGFPLDAILIAGGLYASFAVFNHSNTKLNLRWIEGVFVTPRLHRMHHLTGVTCQKNLGTVLTLWDRIFGTFESKESGESTYGVPGEAESYPQTWPRQFVEPIKRIGGHTPPAITGAAESKPS